MTRPAARASDVVRPRVGVNLRPALALRGGYLEGFQRKAPRFTGTQPYVKADEHGGVFGVSVPILLKRRSTSP